MVKEIFRNSPTVEFVQLKPVFIWNVVTTLWNLMNCIIVY